MVAAFLVTGMLSGAAASIGIGIDIGVAIAVASFGTDVSSATAPLKVFTGKGNAFLVHCGAIFAC